MINDPAGVKRVLVDNVANYPKTEFERQAFTGLFGTGLLGSDGELWREHRRIMAPSFHPSSVGAYAPAMTAISAAFRARWDERAGHMVDAADEMSLLTLKIIAKTMFSSESKDAVDLIGRTMKQGFSATQFSLIDTLPIIGPAHMRRSELRLGEAFGAMGAVVSRFIAQRQANQDGGEADLLTRLLAARDESGVQLTPKEIQDEVITIFIAGHETTAVAMAWIWYLLSQQPREEATLHAELARVLGGRPPRHEDLQSLTYTRRVVEEALRLYPPASGLATRVCMSDDEICGRKIAAGSNIVIAPFVMHHHPRLWNNPERFDPDRFSPDRIAERHRFAYLPFGAGSRICIGQLLAISELVIILATLAQTHRLHLAPSARVGFVQNITLRPRNLLMTVERR
ncbi:MAG: cytochrome P450 [Pseudomonadota bacterium]